MQAHSPIWRQIAKSGADWQREASNSRAEATETPEKSAKNKNLTRPYENAIEVATLNSAHRRSAVTFGLQERAQFSNRLCQRHHLFFS